MEKPWYKSKAIWGGLVLVVAGIGGIVTEDFSLLSGIVDAALGFMGIGLRLAKN